jgi:hypothetical protein
VGAAPARAERLRRARSLAGRPGPVGALITPEAERPGRDPAARADAARGERAREGLCADCRWARRVTSARGSVFVLCRRAETDPAFPRYPRLPRLACPGHERADSPPDRET